MKLYVKGDKFVCPNCNKEIYEFIKDIEVGETRSSFDVKGINGYKTPEPTDYAECPNCEEVLFI